MEEMERKVTTATPRARGKGQCAGEGRGGETTKAPGTSEKWRVSWRMRSKSRGHLHRDVLIRCWKEAVEWACEGGRERTEGRTVVLSNVEGISRARGGRHRRTRGIPRTWFRRFDRPLETKVPGWQPWPIRNVKKNSRSHVRRRASVS